MTIRTVATLLIAAVILPGCASDEKKPTVLPPAPSPASSAGGAESPLAIPLEASSETSEGASAFVRFYLGVVNDAFAKGDAASVRVLSDAQCESCSNLIDAIDSEGAPGERIEGGDYVVSSVASPAVSDEQVRALVTYELTAVRVFDASGQVIRERPAQPALVASMTLGREADRWSVLDFTNVDR